MDLSELEQIATRLLELEKELNALKENISRLETDLREQPRRSEGEKKFYALIGMEWNEPKVEEKLKELSEKRNTLSKSISEENAKIVSALSERNLILPLDPKPEIGGGGASFFRYRDNSTYSRAVQELANVLGLSVPLKVDDVVIESDKITVAETDPHLAMEKIVGAFDKISKTVSLKLGETPKKLGNRI